MKLSPHFELEEFLFSETAARMGKRIEPTQDVIDNLTRWCLTIGEPLRAALGAPIVITSGYRPPWLNSAIGGSSTSDHMTGCAVDCRAIERAPIVICRTLVRLAVPYKQVIHEFGRWCHVSIALRGDAAKREQLTAWLVEGRTKYFFGLQERQSESVTARAVRRRPIIYPVLGKKEIAA